MRVQALGHVVLRVRDRARAEAFYHGVLGIPVSARAAEWKMTFFTLGRHHDFAVVEAGEGAASPDGGGLGLDHIAFKVGDSLDDLRAAKTRLEQEGIPVASVDHTVSHSLYCHDPDGNTVELYVDTPAPWRDDPSLIVAEARPLDL